MGRVRILLADDHTVVRQGLRKLLLIRRFVVPDELVLHVADTLALDGAGDDRFASGYIE